MYRYHCVLLRGLHILKYYHKHLVVKIYESFMFNKYYIYNVAGILKHPLDLLLYLFFCFHFLHPFTVLEVFILLIKAWARISSTFASWLIPSVFHTHSISSAFFCLACKTWLNLHLVLIWEQKPSLGLYIYRCYPAVPVFSVIS